MGAVKSQTMRTSHSLGGTDRVPVNDDISAVNMRDIRAALQPQPSPSKDNLAEIQRGLAREPDMHEPMKNIMDGLLPLPAKQNVVPTEVDAGDHFTKSVAKAAVSSRDVSMANSAVTGPPLPADVTR